MTTTDPAPAGTVTAVPAVSVVITNFNYAKTLRACLSAVFAQSRPAAEVIVVDDCSTDESVQIAAEFPCTVVRTPRNQGPAAGRNLGIASSSGSIIFFVDSDIALAPDSIEQAVRILDADPGVGCVYGIYQKEPLYADGWVEEYRTLHNHYWQGRLAGRVQTAIFALAAVRRKALNAAGRFDESLRQAEDMEYSRRLAQHTCIELTPKITGAHDDDDRLWTVLRKLYWRARLEFLISSQGRSSGRLGAYHRLSLILAVLVPCSAIAAFVSPWLLALSALIAAAFACSDPGLIRFVVRERGPVFATQFAFLHLLAYWALGLGVAAGVATRVVQVARSRGPRRSGGTRARPGAGQAARDMGVAPPAKSAGPQRAAAAWAYLITGALLCAGPLLPFARHGHRTTSEVAAAIWPGPVFLLGLGGCVLAGAVFLAFGPGSALRGGPGASLYAAPGPGSPRQDLVLGTLVVPAATAATSEMSDAARVFGAAGDRVSGFSWWALLLALAVVGCVLIVALGGFGPAPVTANSRADHARRDTGQRACGWLPVCTVAIAGGLLLEWLVAPLAVVGSNIEPYGAHRPVSDVYGALAYVATGAVAPQAIAGLGLAVVLGLTVLASGSRQPRATGVLTGAALTAGVDGAGRLVAAVHPLLGLAVRPLPLAGAVLTALLIAALAAPRFADVRRPWPAGRGTEGY